ncbi:MAG: helix-turn-helix transcriptional regulator [bacterium]|nr:helix-turn-helix transcriptional regulator [bacterium]
MIRNDTEHKKAIDRIKAEKDRVDALRDELIADGLNPDEVKRALDPLMSFHLQLVEEVESYERLQRGDFGDFTDLHGIGRLLISLRIFRGLTQRDLAARLEIHESQVSRDERNEYHGITVGRAARILEVLGAKVSSKVETCELPEQHKLAG